MVFLSELLGAEVIDVHQRSVGAVRDLGVAMTEPYPVVTGLLLGGRARQFVPWSMVRTHAYQEVLLNVERDALTVTQAKPQGTYLARDVLDTQIVDTDGHRVVRVNDLQLSEIAGRLLVVGVDVGSRGLLRRLGLETATRRLLRLLGRNWRQHLIPWDAVESFHADSATVQLKIAPGKLAKLHPADIADIVEELGRAERTAVFAALGQDLAAETIEELEPRQQLSILQEMDTEQASILLEAMAPDEAADILGDLPAARAHELLERMQTAEAVDIEELMAYGENTAGGLMTPDLVSVADGLTAQECIEELRRMEPEAESVYYVYVVDDDHRLIGVLSLRDLIVAQPLTPITAIVSRKVTTVTPSTPAPEVAGVLSKYNLLAVPVVDAASHLLGMVTVDDALERVLPDRVKRRSARPV